MHSSEHSGVVLRVAVWAAAIGWLVLGRAEVSSALLAELPIEAKIKIDSRLGFNDFDWDSEVVESEHTGRGYMRYADVELFIRPVARVEGYLLYRYESKFVHAVKEKTHLDEGWIKLDYGGMFVKAGRIEMPFSYMKSKAVEKPFTWWMGDCIKSGVEAGYKSEYFSASAGWFNGGVDTVDRKGRPADDKMDEYSFRVELKYSSEVSASFDERASGSRLTSLAPQVATKAARTNYSIRVGGGYISDVAETEFDFGADYFLAGGQYRSPTSAVAYYAVVEGDAGNGLSVVASGEYMESGRFSERVYVDARGRKTRVTAEHYELTVVGDRFWVGGNYGKFGGFDWLNAQRRDPLLEATRYECFGGFGGVHLNDYVGLGAQVMHGHDDAGDRVWEYYFQVVLEV